MAEDDSWKRDSFIRRGQMWWLGVCGSICLVGGVWALSQGTEGVGRRDLPGWLAGSVAVTMGVICAVLFVRRLRVRQGA